MILAIYNGQGRFKIVNSGDDEVMLKKLRKKLLKQWSDLLKKKTIA